MDDITHNDDLLIRYLDRELSSSEKAALEDRLHTDAALKQQLVNLQVAMQAARQMGTVQKVSYIHQQMMQQLKSKEKARIVPLSKAIRYSMAIAATLVVVFIGVKWYTASQVSAIALYDEAFVDVNPSSSRSANSNLSEIEIAYQRKEYEKVVNSTRSFHLSAKDSLLIGLSYLHTEKPASAISFFQRISASENEMKEDGEFYLALSYLKNKDYDKASALMQQIHDDAAHLYHAQFDSDFINDVNSLKK